MNFHSFSSNTEQCQELAKKVGDNIANLLASQEQVNLCLPGGTTPGEMFDYLSTMELDWSRVCVLMSDERWVPSDDPLSNEALLRSRLSRNNAEQVRIFSYYEHSLPIEAATKRFNSGMGNVTPLDICVLGMGEDGHTASLFPDMADLQGALDLDVPEKLIVVDSVSQPVLRVSLNMSALVNAKHHYVLLRGERKKAVIEEANKGKDMALPISHLLAACVDTEVYYA